MTVIICINEKCKTIDKTENNKIYFTNILIELKLDQAKKNAFRRALNYHSIEQLSYSQVYVSSRILTYQPHDVQPVRRCPVVVVLHHSRIVVLLLCEKCNVLQAYVIAFLYNRTWW